MFKKALLATATAGLLAGSLAAAAPASASTSIHLSTPGVGLAIASPHLLPQPHAQWVCEPEYRYVPYWSLGMLKYRLVKVDEDCHWEWQRTPAMPAMPAMPLHPFWPFGW